MSWKNNTIMTWAGNKITDHGRDTLSMSYERIGTDSRTVRGKLRRHHVALKRSWNVSWTNLPHRNDITGGMTTADGGWGGEQIEDFYNTTTGAFRLVLRRGSASGTYAATDRAVVDNTHPDYPKSAGETIVVPNPSSANLPFEDEHFYIADVMFTDFDKNVLKRGKVDLWEITLTMEEV